MHWCGRSEEVESDAHGYFFRCLAPGAQSSGSVWDRSRVELLSPAQDTPVDASGDILLAPPQARRVVVSDIDDTVIFTGVANKLAMLWRLFVHGVEQRVPFPGIAPLYRGLHGGPGGAEHNPMIYLSRSPWTLYPTLEEFFQRHGIPVGPVLLLRDWGITLRHPFPRRARDHKRDLLERVAEVYADLPLLLVGDSGQLDPELYAEFARRRPGRVAGIGIREIAPNASRRRRLEDLQQEMYGLGIPWIAADSTLRLADAMAERGWIGADSLNGVRRHFAERIP